TRGTTCGASAPPTGSEIAQALYCPGTQVVPASDRLFSQLPICSNSSDLNAALENDAHPFLFSRRIDAAGYSAGCVYMGSWSRAPLCFPQYPCPRLFFHSFKLAFEPEKLGRCGTNFTAFPCWYYRCYYLRTT